VLYNRCGCVYGIKDCVRSLQAQTTAVQNEWKVRESREGKNGDKRGPLFGVGLLCSLFFPLFLLSSLFAVLAAYRLVRVRYTHRMAHMCALVFSVSFNFIKRNRER
jgi:ABC-type glycerol-3-phosphate transport system permease component